MQLVARVVVLLDDLADEVSELGDALLLPLELLLGCLQLQHGVHQALLQRDGSGGGRRSAGANCPAAMREGFSSSAGSSSVLQ
jgi:hypothetical protein